MNEHAKVEQRIDSRSAPLSANDRDRLAQVRREVLHDRVHLALGAATAVLPALIQELGLDLIVMGTHARDGISGLLVGNTVEKIMPRVDCGVVVVKPDDFLSLVVREAGLRM